MTIKKQTNMTNKNYIRHFAAILLGCLFCAQAYAQQHTTEFVFRDTASPHVIERMQTNARALFAEINSAHHQNRNLSLSLNNVTERARRNINDMWGTSRFYSTETRVVERVIRSAGGYQVRNIPVFFKDGAALEDQYQDIVLEFAPDGRISDVFIAIHQHQFLQIMGNSTAVEDTRRRLIVVDFVENFRTAFNRRDIDFIESVFSQDALIITGGRASQVQRSGDGLRLNSPQFDRHVRTTAQYIEGLRGVFARNTHLNVRFDNIVVTRCEARPNRYGVTLKQNWNSSTFNSEGWLFLLIDYEDENNPLIWVRTWQPLVDDFGMPTREEEIFGLGHFN